MRLEYQQNLRLEQRLLQSPQMIQAMQILQLTTPELLERIEEELEDNPFLEVDGQGGEGEAAPEGAGGAAAETAETPPDLAKIGQFFEGGRGAAPGARRAGAAEDGYDAVQNLVAPDLDTSDTILGEFRVNEEQEDRILAAETLLSSLDPRGYLPEGVEKLAEISGIPQEVLEQALQRLRVLAHPALGARDLKECYLLQLDSLAGEHEVAKAIVRDHFDELLANRLPQIARELGVSLGEVRKALETLGGLDSRPLDDYEFDDSRTIMPDVIVDLDENGRYQARLTRDGLPELRLSRGAREALEHAKSDKRLHAFLLKKIERARWFLDAVAQRRQTLKRIAQAMVDRQREFLDYGPERLRPLKMQEIADVVGVHISTVSRAIRGKFAQTSQGILPLKNLFSGGQRTATGGQRSRVSIQERIREIIGAEDKTAPLSDEEIVRVLAERDGVKVARRTITKYRKALEIPASTLRRNY